MELIFHLCTTFPCKSVSGVSDEISARSVSDDARFVFLSITRSLMAVGLRSVKGKSVSIFCQQKKQEESVIELMSGGASSCYPLKADGVSHLTDFMRVFLVPTVGFCNSRKKFTKDTFTVKWIYNKAWWFIFIFTPVYSLVLLPQNIVLRFDNKHIFPHCSLRRCILPLHQTVIGWYFKLIQHPAAFSS